MYHMSYYNAVSRLEKNGYERIGSNVASLTLLMKKDEEPEHMHIVACLDNVRNSQITPEQLENIGFQLERKFLLEQVARKVDILFIIFTDNLDRDKCYANGNIQFWLADELGRQFVIFENQPEDFYGIRTELEDEYEKHSWFRVPEIQIRPIPIITIGLILINVIVHIILEKNGDTHEPLYMLRNGAVYSGLVFNEGQYYRLFTAMFMHFGTAHLLNNMLALALMGTNLERTIGKLYFTIVYLFSGVMGCLVSAINIYYKQTLTVSAGASGAIFGILGAIMVLAVLSAKNRGISVYFRIILVLLILLDTDTSNVDVIAHAGGFVAGIVSMTLIYLYNKFKQRKLKKEE